MIVGRTFWRRMGIAALGLIALWLLAENALRLYGRERLAAARARFEKEIGSLDLRSYNLPPVPAERNAALWIEAGAGSLLFFDRDKELLSDLAAKTVSEWSAGEQARLASILDRNVHGMAILDDAQPCDASTFNIDLRRVEAARLPPLLSFVHAARLLRTRADLELRQGPPERSALAVGTLGCMAASLEREPVPMAALIGMVVERHQLGAMRELVQDPRVGVRLLEHLRSGVPAVDLASQFRRSEAAESASVVRQLLGESGEDFPRYEPVRYTWRWIGRRLPDLAAAEYLEFQRGREPDWAEPYPVARAKRRDGRGGAGTWLIQIADWDQERQIDAKARISSILSLRRLAILSIDLRLEAERAGRYPADLPDIALAREPDPFTGEPLKYQVRGDGSAELTVPGAGKLLAEVLLPSAKVYRQDAYRWILPPPGGRGGP